MEIEYCCNGGFYIHAEEDEKSGKYRRILKVLVQFEGNYTRILGFPDRKKEKKFQECYVVIKKEKESTFVYNFEFLI